jgi:putative acetyltransferase
MIIVATSETDGPAGYVLLEPKGHIDHLYIDRDSTRMGLADALLGEAEGRVRDLAGLRLFTEASDLARPAFERAGYRVARRRDFEIDSVAIHNWAMEKALT